MMLKNSILIAGISVLISATNLFAAGTVKSHNTTEKALALWGYQTTTNLPFDIVELIKMFYSQELIELGDLSELDRSLEVVTVDRATQDQMKLELPDNILDLIETFMGIDPKPNWNMFVKKKLKNYPDTAGYWKSLKYDADFTTKFAKEVHLNTLYDYFRLGLINLEKAKGALIKIGNTWFTLINYSSHPEPYNDQGTTTVSFLLKVTHSETKKVSKRVFISHTDYTGKKIQWYNNDGARYDDYTYLSDNSELVKSNPNLKKESVRDEQIASIVGAASRQINPFEVRAVQVQKLANLVATILGTQHKPLIYRMTMAGPDSNQIINMEQVAINSYYDQFPRNVRVVDEGYVAEDSDDDDDPSDNHISDED